MNKDKLHASKEEFELVDEFTTIDAEDLARRVVRYLELGYIIEVDPIEARANPNDLIVVSRVASYNVRIYKAPKLKETI